MHSVYYDYAPNSFQHVWTKNNERENAHNLRNENEDAAPMAYHFNHNIEADFENETLPPSEQFFDNTYELKFESLELLKNSKPSRDS